MNIIIVEDQAIVRDALSALLSLEADIDVQATFGSSDEALAFLAEHAGEVDVVLTDIQMPAKDGIALCGEIRLAWPQLPVVVLTTFGRAGYLKRALAAGARGFLLKDTPSERLTLALRDVFAGKQVIDSELALTAMGDQDPLTEKERRALALAATGLSTQAIADALCLSHGTVRNYLSEAMSKLHASNRIDAARIAHERGWI